MSQWNAKYIGVGLPGSPVTYNGERYSGVIFHPKVNATLYLENGLRHRTDGPAIEHTNGLKIWYVKDQRHRLDGPAFEGTDGRNAWWYVDGQKVDILAVFGYEPSVPLTEEQQMVLRLSV